MPLKSHDGSVMAAHEFGRDGNSRIKRCMNPRPHEESQETAGFASHRYFALVHTPVPLADAMKIPAAVEALDKEWSKLQDKVKAWDLSSVMEREDVIKSCRKRGRTPHFGTLMTLCHEKHSELNTSLSSMSGQETAAKVEKKYKGRVVFRGNNVKDENAQVALFQDLSSNPAAMEAANAVVFEGATSDAHETTLTITDPTADRTITLPDQSGEVILVESREVVIDGNINIESTSGGSEQNPYFTLRRKSATPANGDTLGVINFAANNSAFENMPMATIKSRLSDATDGSEDGNFELHTRTNGSMPVSYTHLTLPTSDLV